MRHVSATGVAIGCVGCVILTASSVYTALKLGALPWPTIFTSITALVLLRAFGRGRGHATEHVADGGQAADGSAADGRETLNEANVTQVIMSAGSMVAGGLAFTIPGAWMLGESVSWGEMLATALAGTLLGLVCTALIRKRFVDESGLEYPIGTAAAKTLEATTDRGGTGKKLFASLGIAGVYCALRDALGVVPTMLCTLSIPGVTFGIYNSPMMVSLGFLVGGSAIAAWFAGAVLGNLGIPVVSGALGLCSTDVATGIVSSLGMGLMMGSGLGVVAKDVVPALVRAAKARGKKDTNAAADVTGNAAGAGATSLDTCGVPAGLLGLFVAAAALVICFALGLGPVVAVAVVLLSFVTTIMSAQSVGQTGIDPMEIFGLIVLLFVAAISDASGAKLFFVAGVVAVTCGLAGDVMSDFKTGALIGTDPHDMWVGQAIGSLLGVGVAVATMCALFGAYGPDAFGTGKEFVSAQASVVATMVSGIPSVPAFVVGLAGGIALYVAGLPSMMIGLGVYLPFYMSLTAAVGAVAKVVASRIARAHGVDPDVEEETGVVAASGLLGGESIVGVIIALASVAAGLAG